MKTQKIWFGNMKYLFSEYEIEKNLKSITCESEYLEISRFWVNSGLVEKIFHNFIDFNKNWF